MSQYTQEVGELICVVLKELEERCPWMAYSIEQVHGVRDIFAKSLTDFYAFPGVEGYLLVKKWSPFQ